MEVAPSPVAPAAPALTLARVQDHIWNRYVQFGPPGEPIDEEQALALLERHHTTSPMAKDAECFYLGILAYELSFGQSPTRQRARLRQALAAFQAYRAQTKDGFAWEPVEDRYSHLVDELWPKLEASAGAALI